jgi:hypothetical protein
VPVGATHVAAVPRSPQLPDSQLPATFVQRGTPPRHCRTHWRTTCSWPLAHWLWPLPPYPLHPARRDSASSHSGRACCYAVFCHSPGPFCRFISYQLAGANPLPPPARPSDHLGFADPGIDLLRPLRAAVGSRLQFNHSVLRTTGNAWCDQGMRGQVSRVHLPKSNLHLGFSKSHETTGRPSKNLQ